MGNTEGAHRSPVRAQASPAGVMIRTRRTGQVRASPRSGPRAPTGTTLSTSAASLSTGHAGLPHRVDSFASASPRPTRTEGTAAAQEAPTSGANSPRPSRTISPTHSLDQSRSSEWVRSLDRPNRKVGRPKTCRVEPFVERTCANSCRWSQTHPFKRERNRSATGMRSYWERLLISRSQVRVLPGAPGQTR